MDQITQSWDGLGIEGNFDPPAVSDSTSTESDDLNLLTSWVGLPTLLWGSSSSSGYADPPRNLPQTGSTSADLAKISELVSYDVVPWDPESWLATICDSDIFDDTQSRLALRTSALQSPPADSRPSLLSGSFNATPSCLHPSSQTLPWSSGKLTSVSGTSDNTMQLQADLSFSTGRVGSPQNAGAAFVPEHGAMLAGPSGDRNSTPARTFFNLSIEACPELGVSPHCIGSSRRSLAHGGAVRDRRTSSLSGHTPYPCSRICSSTPPSRTRTSLGVVSRDAMAVTKLKGRRSLILFPDEVSRPKVTSSMTTCMVAGCTKVFTRHQELDRHLNTHWPPNLDFRCIGVPMAMAEAHGLSSQDWGHKEMELDNVKYVGGCGKVFSRADALNRHLSKETCIGQRVMPKGNRLDVVLLGRKLNAMIQSRKVDEGQTEDR